MANEQQEGGFLVSEEVANKLTGSNYVPTWRDSYMLYVRVLEIDKKDGKAYTTAIQELDRMAEVADLGDKAIRLLARLVNSPNVKSNQLWDECRDLLKKVPKKK